jgi:hypothetical protein
LVDPRYPEDDRAVDDMQHTFRWCKSERFGKPRFHNVTQGEGDINVN